jgi:hypothetical protein
MTHPNEDLVGARFNVTSVNLDGEHRSAWVVTGLSRQDGYVNLTGTDLDTGKTVETCKTAHLIRLRLQG